MTDRFSEQDVVTLVTRLTRSQLVWFIEGALIRPERDESGYVFKRIDIARLELLCDLSQDLELDETALRVVISLIDQLHAARQDLTLLTRCIDALPADTRAQITDQMRRS
jgi:chaperone modulatory protein CbpM